MILTNPKPHIFSRSASPLGAVALFFAVAALGSGVGGCKGDTVYKDRQETLKRLGDTEEALAKRDETIKQLSATVTELRGSGGEGVVISMEGPKENGEPGAIIEVKGKGPSGGVGGGNDPVGNAKDTELYKAFIAKVKGSRGSIKKCYEGALKKRADLQERSVIVNIFVDYRTTGAVSAARVQPQVTPNFERCVRAVAERWKLPAMPRVATFRYPQKLTPQ